MNRLSLTVLAAIVLAAGYTGSAHAQTPSPDNTELLKKVQDLETSLAAIKAELAQRGIMPSLAPPIAASQPVPPPPPPL